MKLDISQLLGFYVPSLSPEPLHVFDFPPLWLLLHLQFDLSWPFLFDTAALL